MDLTGKHLIKGRWQASGREGTFQAVDPANNESLPTEFFNASLDEVELAAQAAATAFATFSHLPLEERAGFLDECASQLDAAIEQIVPRAMAETGLPELRLRGELGRTTGQLRQFSAVLRRGDWKRVVIDTAQPERQPVPKPDIRLTQIALGPVVVFGASNFPLAFSVAGGDTASALAAGCPVIVKGHEAHPGTSELVAQCLQKAIETCKMPEGTFALLHGPGRTIGAQLIQHPAIKAGGFTGSIAAGRALLDLANQRPDPIPFFGELGSSNPIFLLDSALSQKGSEIAQGFVGAMTLGAGQFCTNPGILVLKEGKDSEAFLSEAAKAIGEQQGQCMLTPAIAASFVKGNEKRQTAKGVSVKAFGPQGQGNLAQPVLMAVSAQDYLADADLQEEIFGPSTLAILCDNDEQMLAIAASFHGHLTSSLFASNGDEEMSARLSSVIQQKVGRLIFNGFGTGVEVCAGMSHGGPYPSSTHVQSTSVGERAIDRFVRPLCYQNSPQALLPLELKDDNPLGIPRLVNGVWTSEPL
ncbi:MAG: aldehyde dehydrogenase (NADP(+)) [Cohaesibacter sp.]|nr:aldehyde dehydrogenase (NADP(+)) [Cohaesibacter sp.]MCV6602850.1 aldehyde dehydrogenase (NADP(+)) [Cohaesibacter sp.]